ncbi:uncharacterized protein LOC131298614 [Rhododendron vialii]|uniref:uncharacterized protein LOC131298614 n=1 Tax=Rhododendron vialii TaxID=182163 RepID=UPI00265EA255|nr:uncharacterized protein LOC131298614 [Rhododendron vialii]
MAGIPPRQILASLWQSNPNCKAIARMVYNAKVNITKVVLAGRTMIQALFDELGQGDFTFDIKRDENGHLTHLFFAHPFSIALTKSYPYVFVMDCTYKTNKYKMPLLDMDHFILILLSCKMRKKETMCGHWKDSVKFWIMTNKPFLILSDRELALMNVIKVVFPGIANILCVWHIEKNILKVAEGAHGMLKKYLTVSTGNFNEVRKKVCLAIENQYNEIKAKIASEKLRVTHKFRIPILKELVSHVSNFAFGELFKQHELATSSILGPCRGHFSKTMGLPCAHMMTNKKGESLLLSNIHPQWRIDIRSFTNVDGGVIGNGSEIECLLKKFQDKYKCMPLVEKEDSLKQIAQLIDAPIPLTLEPSIQPHKGRPSGSKKRKGDSSTTRDPSAFEIVENTRKCSVCHHIGHDSRTCPHKDENTSRSPHFLLANQLVNINMLETQFECEIKTSLEL